jgi:hypothetical protein
MGEARRRDLVERLLREQINQLNTKLESVRAVLWMTVRTAGGRVEIGPATLADWGVGCRVQMESTESQGALIVADRDEKVRPVAEQRDDR